MQIPGFIRNIPSHLQSAWERAGAIKQETQHLVANQWAAAHRYCNQTSLWQQYAKPIYERNIKPLNKIDYTLLTGGLISAGTVMAVSMSIFGLAAFPIAIGTDTFLVLGSWSLSRHRLQKHFNEIAWDYADQIRRAVNDITSKNRSFVEITRFKGLLEKPEFAHLEQDVKQLNDEIEKFRKVASGPYYQEKKQTVKAHLSILKRLVNKDADKGVISQLEQEIDKSGTQEQNLELLETHKQQLQQLQTTTAREHLPSLTSQIDELIRSIQGPKFIDSKQTLIQSLENLMRNKLAPHKEIEPLNLREALDVAPNQHNENNPIANNEEDLEEGIEQPQILVEQQAD
jgi:hypothetical protein